jgi:hypothetical protein
MAGCTGLESALRFEAKSLENAEVFDIYLLETEEKKHGQQRFLFH